MVKYVTMKRITQIIASVLFVITVLTLYLAVDFVISNATTQKSHGHRRAGHFHPPDEIKISRKRSIPPPLIQSEDKLDHSHHRSHNSHHDDLQPNGLVQNRSANKTKPRAKTGHFHKGKTGVKVNRPHPDVRKRSHKHSASNMTKILTPHIVRQHEPNGNPI